MEDMNNDLMQEIRAAFQIFDPHNTGKITSEQMGKVMQNLGHFPTEAELYDMIDEIDLDGDGEIDFYEFLHMMIRHSESLTKDENLMVAFKLFDRDDDGFISPLELRNVMYNLGERCTEEEFNDMMKEIDFDNDGKLSFQEFVNGLKN
ncbi:neo-calmodulin-like [Drosophila sulfurigaster albostrigata]|uniref:neo-calmodulin-like n=1 Tax=Drosophila sulfurigaster albostrigata TaxID=89887 RepID=UPI002D21AC50|nr:neo-calmodulin-like [Drosophila sulfurigaster albostrigata]